MANLEYFSDEDVISFTLLDAHTVERLQREGDIKLPRKKVDIPKDERWNTKQMSSKLLQGILAGDAIPTIANSLMQVIGNNAAAAVRNARTMVTGAENVGRLDSYEDLAEKGVVQKKVWIATADDRTRESHLLLDGEEVDIDKPFSNGLMYPADPSGDPAEVYNCRCSMRDHIVGFRRADGSISYVGAERDTTSHAGKIEDEIAQRGLERAAEVPAVSAGPEAESDRTVVNGSNISGSWTRRPDEFDFAIEDVVDAQGFNGLPKVVDDEEFQRYVEDSNIIMQRGYAAPDPETLKLYQDELYNGEWYLECSGGSAYGKGMYAAYNTGIELSQNTMNTANAYGGGPNGIVETMTLDSSAKIISYRDAEKLVDQFEDSGLSEKMQGEFIVGKVNEIYGDDYELKQYVLDRYFSQYHLADDGSNSLAWYRGLEDSKRDQIDKTVRAHINDIASQAFKIADYYDHLDAGTVAALYGYDAVRVKEDAGYIIILNRTKLIIKGK